MNEIIDPIKTDFQGYKELRAEITYEAHLAVSRTTWSIASQAFLFTSLAAGVKTSGDSAHIRDSLLYPLVPTTGIVISVFTLASVLAALLKAHKLANRIKKNHADHVGDYLVESGFTAFLGVSSTAFIPAVFIVAWLFILFGP